MHAGKTRVWNREAICHRTSRTSVMRFATPKGSKSLGHQWVPIFLWRKRSPRGWMKSENYGKQIRVFQTCSAHGQSSCNTQGQGATTCCGHCRQANHKNTRKATTRACNEHGCVPGRITRRTIGPTTSTRVGHIAHASRRCGGQISKTNRSRGVLGILGGCTAHDATQTSRGCRRHHPTFGARSRAWRMFARVEVGWECIGLSRIRQPSRGGFSCRWEPDHLPCKPLNLASGHTDGNTTRPPLLNTISGRPWC